MYAYLDVALDTESIVDWFIFEVCKANVSWNIFDEDNSPFKTHYHLENGSDVDW